MLILHASAIHEQLLVWGEAPPGERPRPPRRRGGRKPRETGPQSSPYDAGAEAILATVLGAGIERRAAADGTAIAWLPAVAGGLPLASSALIAELSVAGDGWGSAVLAPWTVSALRLTAAEAVELLCLCAGRHTLAPGVVIGPDLAFWTRALRFAGALVARQQLLPGLIEDSGTYRAAWQPVFAGADAARLEKLASAMPPACRGLALEVAAEPTAASPPAVLAAMIGAWVDHLVRTGQGDVAPPLPPFARPAARRRATAPTFDSVHDQWLHALRSADGRMAGDEAELARLKAAIGDWQRPIAASAASPFRLCFRLEEPAAEGGDGGETRGRRPPPDDPWYVRYLMQAVADPSLLVPAEEVFGATGRRAAGVVWRSILRRGDVAPREHLLAALGQASQISTDIERSLRSPVPSGYALDAGGAHAFLTGTALELEQAGFGVLLPAWWTRRGTKLRLAARAHVKSPSLRASSGLSLDALVAFEWEIALGGERLTLRELEALARLKVPLVRLRGQWVQMSAEDIRAALDFWKRHAAGKAAVRDIVQMALGAPAAAVPAALAFEGLTATGWVAELLDQLDGRAAFEELPAPEGFRGTLRPYQVRGASWLAFLRRWGLGACLADDMGLGKTIQTLALLERDRASAPPTARKPALLVCPTSVMANWEKEAARFTPRLKVMVHHGVARPKGAAFVRSARKHGMVVSSYALLHRDLELLQQVPWSAVILDEAQNVKNPETKQARAARALRADCRIALTGTPVENHVGDLWSIMEFLNPGFLGSQAGFKRSFLVPIQAERDPEAAARLRQLTGPFILRRLKTDPAIIRDLPDKMEMKVFCTLTREQASLYAAVLKEMEDALGSAEGIERKGVILATLMKLKQVCNHPTQFLGDNSPIPGRSGKLARLTEMLDEVLEAGDRALVFSQFAEMGEILRRHLEETFGREVLFLHGGVPRRKRDAMVERFQAAAGNGGGGGGGGGGGDGAGGPPIFILSLKAGGTGLNLTAANHVFHYDRWWNPAVENQATDRAFRIGQRRNVQVHKFLCAGTLEERIDEMIERKKAVAEEVVGSGEGWLTRLSTAELKDLFALRAEAVED